MNDKISNIFIVFFDNKFPSRLFFSPVIKQIFEVNIRGLILNF